MTQQLEDRYELEFTIEVLQGRPPIAKEQVFNCRGIFKILPKRGTFTAHILTTAQRG